MPERTVLVTGFGAFPGAPNNPTARLIDTLSASRAHLRRQGINLELRILPVVYAQIEPLLARYVAETRPDAILHFGLAGRRRVLSVETRAVNRIGVLHPDAARARAPGMAVVPEGPPYLRCTCPARRIDVALQRAGLASRLSIDAGDYVCNQTLYLSLARRYAPSVGFIHVPRLMRPDRPSGNGRTKRPTPAMLTRAALIAIRIVGAHASL